MVDVLRIFRLSQDGFFQEIVFYYIFLSVFALFCIACIVLHGIVLYCILWYCIIVYFVVLHRISWPGFEVPQTSPAP